MLNMVLNRASARDCASLISGSLMAWSMAFWMAAVSPQKMAALRPSKRVSCGYEPRRRKERKASSYEDMGKASQLVRMPVPMLPHASQRASSISIWPSSCSCWTLRYRGLLMASGLPRTTGLKPCAHQALLHCSSNFSSASLTDVLESGS